MRGQPDLRVQAEIFSIMYIDILDEAGFSSLVDRNLKTQRTRRNRAEIAERIDSHK